MDSDGGKRQSGGNLATTNGRPSVPASNDGGAISGEVGESRQNSVDIHEPEEYDIQARKNKSTQGNPSPRHQTYTPNQTAPTNSSTKDQAHVLEPPVTKATLSELDVNKIVNNPKLRHDINFDPDLHFRPNLDGEKGRRKTQKANIFWETMRNELREYLTNRDAFEKEHGEAEWCLPLTLNAIRGILETLVPQRDRASVEETFNVELLMQQFRKGVADMVKLADWLSRLLKSHCAPMRDDWVDEMVNQLSNGDRNWDVVLLALGMKNLLGVLEAMKLDVANHQIRCLRPLLIEDTVHFEQKFFMKKIAMGRRVDIAGAHAWFKAAGSMHSQGDLRDFMKALVNLTLPSKSSGMVPHTFLFDEERLIKLRSDMQDLINLVVCMQVYRKWEMANRSTQDIRYAARNDTPIGSYTNSPFRPASPAGGETFSSPTLPFLNDFAESRPKHILTEERINRSFSSTPSSLGSSPLSSASNPETLQPTPLYLPLPLSDSARQVHTSLLAILSSSAAPDKWTALSSSLALQIFRSTTTPMTSLPEFESRLASYLSNPCSSVYQAAEKEVLSRLFPALEKLVETYTPLTSLQIFEAATAPRIVPGHFAGQGNGEKEEINEIATRIAHIGILHWRVWAPLAYLVDPDAEEEQEALIERAKSMP